MSDVSRLAEPAKKRRWLPRFGMRAVFFLIALAAVVAWWVQSDVLPTVRREELIKEYSKAPNELATSVNGKPTLRERIVAWVRGKPVLPRVQLGQIERIGDLKQFVEFANAFKMSLEVQVPPDEVTPEVLDALSQCNSLTHLSFEKPVAFSDELLAALARIKKGGIHVSAPKNDDLLLKGLADAGVGCERITAPEDYLPQGQWFRATDEGLRSAARLKKLKYLTASRNAGDEGFAAFRDHDGLTLVELIGPGYTDKSAEVLATLPNLAGLTLVDTQLTDEEVAKVIAGRRLGSLKLHNLKVSEKTIEAISDLPSLYSVDLKGVRVTPELVAALIKHQIGKLSIEGECDDERLASLAPLAPNLMSLSLATPSVTDAGLEWIAQIPILSELHLRDTSITGKTMRARSSAPQLSLGGPQINKETLADTKSINPVYLWLFGETIDDEGLAALPTSVAMLQLTGTRVTVNGLKAFPPGQPQVNVRVQYVEGSSPPYSEQEIEEINIATQGRIKVRLYPLPEKTYQDLLPKSSRKD